MPRNAAEAAALQEMMAEAELERTVVNGLGFLLLVVATVCLLVAVRALATQARNRSWRWGCLATVLFLLGLLLANHTGVVF